MFFFPMGNLKACHDDDIDQNPEQAWLALGNHNLIDGYALSGTSNVIQNERRHKFHCK